MAPRGPSRVILLNFRSSKERIHKNKRRARFASSPPVAPSSPSGDYVCSSIYLENIFPLSKSSLALARFASLLRKNIEVTRQRCSLGSESIENKNLKCLSFSTLSTSVSITAYAKKVSLKNAAAMRKTTVKNTPDSSTCPLLC